MGTSRLEQKAELQRLRSRRDAAAMARLRYSRVLIGALLLGVVSSVPYHLVFVRWLGADPWLGAHHRLACPLVCDGCAGPYQIFSWTSSSTPTASSMESTRVYCRTKASQFANHSEAGFLADLAANRAYELPGASYTLYLSSLLLWTALALPAAIIIARRRTARLRSAVPQLNEQIAEAESRMKRPSRNGITS